jgi:1,2-diacylglycerol 3-alpha-glucosyltransferase
MDRRPSYEAPLSGRLLATIWANYGPYHMARVRALRERGFRVVPLSYCARNDDYPFFTEEPEGNIVINECELHGVRWHTSFVRTLRLLHKLRPDIVLACGHERPETLAARIYSKTLRLPSGARPVAIVMTEVQAHDRHRRITFEFMKATYLRLFDSFMVGGSRCRDYLVSLGVSRAGMQPGYDCVDNDAIERMADAFRQSSHLHQQKSPYFICVARLVAQKNLATLISAYETYCRRLANGSDPWQLLICGDGPERRRLEIQVDSLGLHKLVRFVGQTDRLEDTVGYLAFGSVFILPSCVEPWGLVVNEAMAAGLPVLVSRQCGCSPDLVLDGQNGFSFDCNDPEELADKMLWMQANDARLHGMGQKSREIVGNYSPAQFAANVELIVDRRLKLQEAEAQ